MKRSCRLQIHPEILLKSREKRAYGIPLAAENSSDTPELRGRLRKTRVPVTREHVRVVSLSRM